MQLSQYWSESFIVFIVGRSLRLILPMFQSRETGDHTDIVETKRCLSRTTPISCAFGDYVNVTFPNLEAGEG